MDSVLAERGWIDPARNYEGVLTQNRMVRVTEITDGTTNTLLMAEAAGRPKLWRAGRLVPGAYSDGAAWATQNAGTQANLSGVWGSGRDDVFVVGDGGTILRTNDGGATWNTQFSPVTFNLHAISFADARNGVVVGGSGTQTPEVQHWPAPQSVLT